MADAAVLDEVICLKAQKAIGHVIFDHGLQAGRRNKKWLREQKTFTSAVESVEVKVMEDGCVGQDVCGQR